MKRRGATVGNREFDVAKKNQYRISLDMVCPTCIRVDASGQAHRILCQQLPKKIGIYRDEEGTVLPAVFSNEFFLRQINSKDYAAQHSARQWKQIIKSEMHLFEFDYFRCSIK